MPRRGSDLERLTTLLGQCLGRIEEQAYRLQTGEDEFDPDDAGDVLEREAAMLQEIVGSVLLRESSHAEEADLNRIVDRALHASVAECGKPIVSRTDLATSLPPVACSPRHLASAVQRAFTLALGSVGPGGEVAAMTRVERDAVWFEIEVIGGQTCSEFAARAATLTEFVRDIRGSCRIDGDGRGTNLIAMQLPAALVR